MTKKSLLFFTILGIVIVSVGFLAGVYYTRTYDLNIISPAILTQKKEIEKPLLAYTIPQLRSRPYVSRTVDISETLTETDTFTSYVFKYDALGKMMSGQLNIPKNVSAQTPVIILLRGYVPLEIFTTGVGTRNAAAVFARNGFITIAPDFFGYGTSDPEPTDSWQARFEKPVAVIELIKTIREKGVPLSEDATQLHSTQRIGIWGHSNGGQIAMNTLVVLQEPIPTSLWAPVLVPFPYSILYFTDENDDEGKGMRIWLSQFEADYELREFSFTQYLDGLAGPLQIQHGTNDEAAPYIWSDEFVAKLAKENKRRTQLRADQAEADTAQAHLATTTAQLLTPIQYRLITYPGADHNMQPSTNWDQAVQKDLEFFRQELVAK